MGYRATRTSPGIGKAYIMARTTHVVIKDDLDGSEGAEEVSFAYAGTEYTIDLGEKSRAKLEKALKPFIDAGTKVPASRRSARKGSGSASGKSESAVIRAWAKDNGHEVPDRGRVPQAVVDAYNAR